MNYLEEIFLRFFETSINASIFLVFVLLFCKVVKEKQFTRVKYSFLILVMLRLLMPVNINSSFNIDLFNAQENINQGYEVNSEDQENIASNEDKQGYLPSAAMQEGKSNTDNQVYADRIGSIESQQDKASTDTQNYNENSNDVLQLKNDTEVEKSISAFSNENGKENLGKNFENEANLKHLYSSIIGNSETNILRCIAVIWSAGVILLIIVFLISLLRFKNKHKNFINIEESSIGRLKDEIACELNIKKKIRLCLCDDVISPCILGIFNPKIYIPRSLMQLNKKEDNMRFILMHELMHYKRGDIFVNVLSIISLILHWYNPLVWIGISKMKTYREYVCDAGVLEYLGEENNIEYGMTLINYSKVSLKTRKYERFALGFDNNSEIKGRINMIKNFREGNYKLSKKTYAVFAASVVLMLTTGISINAYSRNNTSENVATSNKVNSGEESESIKANEDKILSKVLIDSKFRNYDTIDKLQRNAGFNFKVPDYVTECNSAGGYLLLKVDDNEYAAQIYFENKDADELRQTSVKAFKGDPAKSLQKIKEDSILGFPKEGDKTETSVKDAVIAGVQGKLVTVNLSSTATPGLKSETTDFVWQDEGINYSVNYKKTYGGNPSTTLGENLSDEEVGKIVHSLKSINEVKNIEYMTDNKFNAQQTTVREMAIYNTEDLQMAEDQYLGFNPKMPLDIDEYNVKIESINARLNNMFFKADNASTGYEIDNFYIYTDKVGTISFKGSKDNIFNDIEINNGISLEDYEKQEITLGSNAVTKYFNKNEGISIYNYKIDDIYYSLSIFYDRETSDNVAEKFVTASTLIS